MDTTNSKHEAQLHALICECIDQSMYCPSSPEIQDIGFRVARIERKLDKKLLRIWEVVKEIRDSLAAQDDTIH